MSHSETHSFDPQSAPRADDGSPLEVKEGILLDSSGQPIAPESSSGSRKTSIFVWNNSWLALPILIGVALPFILMTGVAVIAIFLVILALYLLTRTLFPKSYSQ